MFSRSIVLTISCGALAFGCTSEREAEEDRQEIIENLIQAGFPHGEISVTDGVVYVGRDAAVSLQASREMLEVGDATGNEQYRTSNLVSSNLQTICIDGSKFSGTFSTALDSAIENYNTLELSFSMRRITSSTAGCDAIITMQHGGPAGGISGFPSGGLPYTTVRIGASLKAYDVHTVTHVITHELGHTVGLRHSDYFDRSISCGSGGDEGDGGVGAILIQGTPNGAMVGGSVMNSCFRTVEAGEFTSTDVTALQTLY